MKRLDSNTFEHVYFISLLEKFMFEMGTDKSQAQTTDKYAAQITAFMNGKLVQAEKDRRNEQDRLSD